MPDPEEYVEAVLALVEQVPPGRVTTYGTIAAHLAGTVLVRGPRTVGRVMSLHGGGVPWWRVVRADGTLPASHGEEAFAAYADEGTPLLTGARRVRVDVAAAFWEPDEVP